MTVGETVTDAKNHIRCQQSGVAVAMRRLQADHPRH